MVTNDIDLEYILTGYLPTIEYEAQYEFQHQIAVEASAARTENGRKTLQDLVDKTRVRLDVSGSTLSIDLYYVSVPEGMEDYSDMLKENARALVKMRVKDMIQDYMGFSDVREKLFNYCKEYVVERLQTALGGISQ